MDEKQIRDLHVQLIKDGALLRDVEKRIKAARRALIGESWVRLLAKLDDGVNEDQFLDDHGRHELLPSKGWACDDKERNVYGMCLYGQIEECLFCGKPEERL